MMSGTRRDSSVVVQFRVFKALLLRDIRTRFFGNGLGYIVAILWPLTHMVMLLTIYTLSGRVAPYGGSVLQFLAIAVVPAITFMYMFRFIAFAVLLNKPLMNFPVVKLVDIILARAVLETVTGILCAVLVAALLFVLNEPVAPRDAVSAALAFLSTLLLGLGIGSLFGVIATKVPGIMLPLVLFNIVIYITSGILFLPEIFPIEIRHILAFNPLLHAIEWMREAYYVGFVSLVLDKTYLVSVGAGSLVLALLVERVFRNFLLR